MNKSRQHKLEEILQDIHSDTYFGTDDSMPDSYEKWLEEVRELNPLIDEVLSK